MWDIYDGCEYHAIFLLGGVRCKLLLLWADEPHAAFSVGL